MICSHRLGEVSERMVPLMREFPGAGLRCKRNGARFSASLGEYQFSVAQPFSLGPRLCAVYVRREKKRDPPHQ